MILDAKKDNAVNDRVKLYSKAEHILFVIQNNVWIFILQSMSK